MRWSEERRDFVIMSTESSSSSSSTTSSSCPTPAPDASAAGPTPGSANMPSGSSGKRFEFLLQQTELFSHFVGDGKKAKSPLKVKTKTKAEPQR